MLIGTRLINYGFVSDGRIGHSHLVVPVNQTCEMDMMVSLVSVVMEKIRCFPKDIQAMIDFEENNKFGE